MKLRHSRIRVAISLVVILAIGLYSKRYRGPASAWVNDSLGGAFYEIFWCLAAAFCVPRWPPGPIAAIVLVSTCVLEFLQLWHPPLLQWARGFFVGRSILGDYFDWWDFPYYILGSAAGYLWLRYLRRG
jgi:hypothetical protein